MKPGDLLRSTCKLSLFNLVNESSLDGDKKIKRGESVILVGPGKSNYVTSRDPKDQSCWYEVLYDGQLWEVAIGDPDNLANWEIIK